MRSPSGRTSTPATWLWFAGVQYDGVTGTDKHLVTEIARERRVMWVDPPLSWRDPRARAARLQPVSVDDWGVVRVRTVVPPGTSRPGLRTVAGFLTRRRARKALRAWGRRPEVTVVSTPEQVLPRGWWTGTRLYYETDDFVAGAALLGHSVRHMSRNRRRNVARSDAVLGVTAEIVRAIGAADKGHVLPNGCHPHLFHREPRTPAMRLELPAPVVGVVGQLNERLDLGALEAVADSGLSLALIGPRYEQDPGVHDALDRLVARPNVQWVDRLPYDQMPSVLAQLRVGLTPYTDSAFNQRSYPLKTLEYLAAGLPVVSTDLPSARLLDCSDVALASNAADFARMTGELVRQAVSEHDVARRRAFASRHSWACRAEELVRIAVGAGDPPLASPQGATAVDRAVERGGGQHVRP